MRTFDDTGKEFLSNYIGSDYAKILPSLEARHAVIFGKASSCENPVLVELNDRAAFTESFRMENLVPLPPNRAIVDAVPEDIVEGQAKLENLVVVDSEDPI